MLRLGGRHGKRVTSDFPSGVNEIVIIDLALLLSAHPAPESPRAQVLEVLGAFTYALAPVINNVDADRGIMRDFLVNVLDLSVEELRRGAASTRSIAALTRHIAGEVDAGSPLRIRSLSSGLGLANIRVLRGVSRCLP